MKQHVRLFRIAVAVLLLFGASLAFAGGAKEPGAGEKVTLKFVSWMVAEASGGEVWIPDRVKAWETLHPNVTVEVIPLAWEDTPDKITLQVQAKNAPDIWTIESLWLGKFGTMPGAVQDLKRYMDASFVSQLVPAYKGGELAGKMFGLVWSPNPWVLVFNKDLVQKAGVSGAPKDFNDFLQQVNAVAKVHGNPYGVGLQLNLDEYSADTFHIIMWQTGGDMLDASGKPVVNSPGTIKAVNLVKDLVDRKAAPFGEDTRNLRTIFAQNKIGFMFEGPWIAGVLDGEGMSRDKWDVSEWPGNVQPASHILCMSANSPHKDLAWDLMKYIVTDETTTKEYFKKTGLMPMIKTQYDDPQYSSHYPQTFLAQFSQLMNPNVWGSQKKYEIEMAFMQALQKIYLGQGETVATLNALQDDLTKMVSR
jgi:multiple sugar transport system substrate-binding protein/arabinogalactan oligomer/maltooligosaccharide transport system substrate-binding protein